MFKKTYKYYVSYQVSGTEKGEETNGFGGMMLKTNTKLNTVKALEDIAKDIKMDIEDSKYGYENHFICKDIVILSIIKLKK